MAEVALLRWTTDGVLRVFLLSMLCLGFTGILPRTRMAQSWSDFADLEDGGIADALLLWSPYHPVPENSITVSGHLIESPGSRTRGDDNKKVCRTRLFLSALGRVGARGGGGRGERVTRSSRTCATRDVRAIAVIHIGVRLRFGVLNGTSRVIAGWAA